MIMRYVGGGSCGCGPVACRCDERLDQSGIVELLDRLHAQNGGWPHLVVALDDHRVAWEQFNFCTNGGYDGLPVGQKKDCRFSLRDGRSLHLHWMEKVACFHVDLKDPVRDPLGHLAQDTNILEGVALGAAMGSLSRNPWGALLGAVFGGLIGAQNPPRRITRWILDGRLPDGRWMALPVGRVPAQQVMVGV
jgi:hypothetical protein